MIRFLDRTDIKELINNSSDFNKRRYGSVVKWGACIAMLLLFAFSLGINNELYGIYSQISSAPSSDIMYVIIFMSFISVAVIVCLLAVINNFRFAISALEFQNALFASSARINSIFCVIANDKKIVYLDKGAQTIFSADKTRLLSDFLAFDGISTDYKEKIREAINTNKSFEFSMMYKDTHNQQKATLVTVTPLEKPIGFFLIKGI